MNLPQAIKIAAFDIKIEEWKPISASANRRYGEFSSMESNIRIDTSVNYIKIVDTLLHEISHAIYWAYGMEDEDKEERIVATFATAWTQIYRDNPFLLQWIHATLNPIEGIVNVN